MWYFSWVLGLGLACAFAILNAMWFELQEDDAAQAPSLGSGYNSPTMPVTPGRDDASE
jgi:cytochrome bd-I ubiquinol oxidase subunit X